MFLTLSNGSNTVFAVTNNYSGAEQKITAPIAFKAGEWTHIAITRSGSTGIMHANGVEVDLTSGNFGITEWKGFSDVSLNLQTQQVPFQDGSVYLDGLLGNREISVTLAVNDNNDLEKRYELRRNLIEILNPKLGEGTLIYKNDYLMRQIKGVPLLPVFKNKNSNGF